MTVTPIADIALKHRAYHHSAGDHGYVMAMSRSGAGTFIAPDRSTTDFQISKELANITLSPNGSMLAVTANDGITIFSTPQFKKTGRLDDTFESCLFTADNLLWTCSHFSNDERIIEVWEPNEKRKIAKAKLKDPYGDTRFFLFRHPEPNSVAI